MRDELDLRLIEALDRGGPIDLTELEQSIDASMVTMPTSFEPRRSFLTKAMGLGAAAAGFAAMGGSASAQTFTGVKDADILNFALNLEYLEAEFYVYGVTGEGITERGVDTNGSGQRGPTIVKNDARVRFNSPLVRQFALELAVDELKHVIYLRALLNRGGATPVAKPTIDILNSFNTAAQAAGLGNSFDPYANDVNFLLGSYIFEDVGVTAYHGAAPLINNKAILDAAAGVLAIEAYHAGALRVLLYQQGQGQATQAISALRRSASGQFDDYGVAQGALNQGPAGNTSIVLASPSIATAFSRSVRQVLNVVYLSGNNTSSGGFFPNGVNGPLQG